jgi:hypothetical protein
VVDQEDGVGLFQIFFKSFSNQSDFLGSKENTFGGCLRIDEFCT